jgi:hypothetical protein
MWANWFMTFLAGIGIVLLAIGLAFAASPLLAVLIALAVVAVIAIVWSMLRGGRETRPPASDRPADPAAPIGAEGTSAARVERQRSGEPVPSEAWSER